MRRQSGPQKITRREWKATRQHWRDCRKMLRMESDLLDPATNIRLGTCYLSMQIAEFEDLSLALAAYNAGPGRVRDWRKDIPEDWTSEDLIRERAFPATRSYVARVLNYRDLVTRTEGGDR